MKRKEETSPKDKSAVVEDALGRENDASTQESKEIGDQRIFLMDNGTLKPFFPTDYTASTLYQVVESFAVECKLVRPEDPGNLVFEGKKPSKKTVPIVVTRSGETVLLDSWESLDSNPEQLADALEVIGATPVKQVFVLKRKEG